MNKQSQQLKLKPKQKVSFTIDSFGKGVLFEGEVIHIDPSATITDGIVNYKIKISINKTDSGVGKLVKPGMNADIKILIDQKPQVLVVPMLAIVEKDNKKYLNIITDEKLNKYILREITTGIEGDGNLIEVTSGVSAGEKIAIISQAL